MNTHELFFYQVYILCSFGIVIIVLFACHTSDQWFDNESNVQVVPVLLYNGKDLIVGDKNPPENTNDNTSFVPPELTPLFFQPIPINHADTNLLLTVPGIGPKLANEIAMTKKQLGRFACVEDLLAVTGIGEKRLLLFKDFFSFQ